MYSSTSSSIDERDIQQAKQNNVLDFIYQILRKECEPGNYVQFLRDGSVIEELMIRACPTPLGKKLKKARKELYVS